MFERQHCVLLEHGWLKLPYASLFLRNIFA